MKFLALFLILLAACTGKYGETNTNESSNQDSLIKVAIPKEFTGVWVLSSYVDAIAETGSPLKASDKLNGVVTMIIDVSGNTDSLLVGASLNNHEGYNFSIYSKPGTRSISYKTNLPDYDDPNGFYEIGASELREGMKLNLYHYSKSGQLKETISFTKVANDQPDHDAGWGIQYMVNQKLISGQYTMVDSKNEETEVTLTNEGKIEGHPIFQSYYFETDFAGGPEPTFDCFTLTAGDKQKSWYAYKKQGNDILLYNTSGEEGEEEINELQFTLKAK